MAEGNKIKTNDFEGNLNLSEIDFIYLLYNQLQEGLIILDIQDNIIFVNEKFCELVGYEKGELIAKSAFDMLYLDDDKESMKTRNIFRKRGINELYELRFIKKNCEIIHVLVNANAIKEDDGKVKGFMASCIDITERKIEEIRNQKLFEELIDTKQLLEQNLQQKNKLIDELIEIKTELQTSNHEKDKFFSIITHDLKNAFSGFLNYIKLFSDDLNNFTLQELSDIVKQMQVSAESLYKLLENLLEWSKIKRNVFTFNPEKHNLNLIISQITSILSINATNKKISLITNIDESIDAFFDPQMLNTILRNIIQNAIKFTKDNGKIEISYKSENNFDIIIIKDEGIGMSPDILDNLFTLNKKTMREGTAGEPSTGLGLLLSKEFIDLHKGKINVESEPGKGSTFYISLPRL